MNLADFILPDGLLEQMRHSPVLWGSGVLAVILLAAVVHALFRAGNHRRHHRHSDRHGREKDKGSAAGGAERRRRRRARLNPTLAETRGLPPVRDESSKPPLD